MYNISLNGLYEKAGFYTDLEKLKIVDDDSNELVSDGKDTNNDANNDLKEQLNKCKKVIF